MSFVKIWIHAVWSTKNRQRWLTPEIRQGLWAHMLTTAQNKDIHIIELNGYYDHVHCLLRLRNDQTIQSVMQQIKGESAYWLNKQKWLSHKFHWQTGYFAVSVSESAISRVCDYIKNQEDHHRQKTFQEEYDEFMERYGFKERDD